MLFTVWTFETNSVQRSAKVQGWRFSRVQAKHDRGRNEALIIELSLQLWNCDVCIPSL